MTREEAIRIIETVFQDEYVYKYYDSITHQALDMAIEALSAPQNNLISREDAVKTVIRKCSPICAWQVGTQQYPDCVVAEINALPSAEAEWIPCSERLPEDSGDYLVCPSDGVIEDYSDCRDVMIIPYDADCEAFGWWTERYDPISLGFVDCDFNEFEVLAWMPLPEPYREDGEV